MRKTKKQLVQRVQQLLEAKPMTIHEIAQSIGSNWDTVKKSVDILIALKLVSEEKSENDNKTIYRVNTNSLSLRKDTYFGIPIIRKEDENLCKMLFMEIRKKWIEKNHYYPNKTLMQKGVVEISDKFKLNIPRGWYIFGQITVLQYSNEVEYGYDTIKPIDGLNNEINIIVEKYSQFKNVTELEEQHYTYNHNILYLTKSKLQEGFTNWDFDKRNLQTISDLLLSALHSIKQEEDNLEIINILTTFYGIFNQITLYYNDKKEIENLRVLLADTFASIWELIASHNFFCSLSEGNFGYDKPSLKKYFDKRIETLIAISWEYLSELDSKIQKPAIKDKDNQLLKYQGILKNPKSLSKEEISKLHEDFKNETSDIFREFNL